MTGMEIQEYLEQTLFALARIAGVGVDFMEPIVLMGKLRVHRRPEDKDEEYYWQQQLLLRVHRDKLPDGWNWTFYNAQGQAINTLFQEKRKKPSDLQQAGR